MISLRPASVNFFLKRHLLLNHWSKFHMNVPHDAIFQNCINGFAPLNRRVTRVQDQKSLKRHLLLDHRPKLEINSQNCSSKCPLPKFYKCVRSTEQKGRKDKKYLKKTSPPEPLVRIQNNFTELLLLTPSTKIAQMVSLH